MHREIKDFKILQRTKDGFFDANELLSQWNSKNTRRRMDDFLKSKTTTSFISALNEDLAIGENPPLAYHVKKGRNTRKGKTKDEVWMHPYLFIDFAMWINPRFKLEVIKFVHDQLIKQRHDAGDKYKVLSSAGGRLRGYNFAEVAKALQWIVFNKTEKEIRQKATVAQLEELNTIQSNLAFAIDLGHIKTYPQLLQNLREIWERKHNPQISA